jgi:hypothetical protein
VIWLRRILTGLLYVGAFWALFAAAYGLQLR